MSRRGTTAIGGLAVVVLAVIFGLGGGDQLMGLTEIEGDQSRSATDVATPDGDYYSITGPAQLEHDPSAPGNVEYCPLDELDRAVCAYGELTSSQRQDAQSRGRQAIDVEPVGWSNNDEVDIPPLEGVEGSDGYHGWFWNRSHMLADSLGGDPSAENLITGTRTQNVGSTQTDGEASGGMAYTERIARDYLDTQDGDSCPLYYAAAPRYSGSELVPRTVIVDIQSCDKSIDSRVEVANTANGFQIDYATGEYAPIR